MESYVNSYNNQNDFLLYKYLYLLSKKYILDNKYKYYNNSTLDSMSIKCASKIFNAIKANKNLNFDDAFFKIINNISADDNYVEDDYLSSFDFNSFQNYLISKLISFKSIGLCDLYDFSSYIEKYMSTIPKKRSSSEWYSIYISVLMSLSKTIDHYKENIFDTCISILPKIKLYNCSKNYEPYIKTIVLQLVYCLRDSFISIISSKKENIFTLHFKDILNKNEC